MWSMNINALRMSASNTLHLHLIKKAKEHLRGRTAVSDHIINCDDCKN